MAKRVKQVINQAASEEMAEQKFSVPGLVFRWVNPLSRERKGWGIWSPVAKDTELGKQIIAQRGETADLFAGLNASSNYFQRGNDSMLAYASVEANEKQKKYLADKADSQLSQVAGEGANLRHTYINTRPEDK